MCAFSKSHNLTVRVVTNGFWATSLKKAISILKTLSSAGLDEINFSTGDEHQKFVPLSNIINGIKIALLLSLQTVINVETRPNSKFNLLELFKDPDIRKTTFNNPKFTIIQGVWMPFTAEGLTQLPKMPQNMPPGIFERCTNLFSGPVIAPDNTLLACCGLPVKYIPQLYLGSLNDHDIYVLYNSGFYDFLKIWLYVDGPYQILRYIQSKSKESIHELNVFSHSCFYCACIYTNQKYLSIVKEHYKEVRDSVFLRYLLLHNIKQPHPK